MSCDMRLVCACDTSTMFDGIDWSQVLFQVAALLHITRTRHFIWWLALGTHCAWHTYLQRGSLIVWGAQECSWGKPRCTEMHQVHSYVPI